MTETPKNIKPVDEHEARLIRASDTFVFGNWPRRPEGPTIITGGFTEARRLVESGDARLVYGYKADARPHALPVATLLTRRNLMVMDHMIKTGALA